MTNTTDCLTTDLRSLTTTIDWNGDLIEQRQACIDRAESLAADGDMEAAQGQMRTASMLLRMIRQELR